MSGYTAVKFMCSPEIQREIEQQLREMGAEPDLTRQDPEHREYCWNISYPIAFEALGRYDLCRQIALAAAHNPSTRS